MRLTAADMLALARSGVPITPAHRIRHCSDRAELTECVAQIKARGEWNGDLLETARDMWRVLK